MQTKETRMYAVGRSPSDLTNPTPNGD